MLCRAIIFFALLVNLPLVFASDTGAPAELETWRDWVLYDSDHVHCPFMYSTREYNCVWTSSTKLRATNLGLNFQIRGQAFAPRWLDLPGDHQFWPVDVVLVDELRSALPVREKQGRAQVYVDGPFIIEGRIVWDKIPSNLKLPNNSGLIDLALNGQPIANTEIDSAGFLWLRKNQEAPNTQQRNSENIQVFRLLDDSNPAELITRVTLDISGEARELRTGQFLLPGFVPLHLNSELPARIENNGDLRVQVKPGHWLIELRARHKGPLQQVAFASQSALWPQHEWWVFQAQRQLRTVQVSGADVVDANQSPLPNEWKHFPAYRVAADSPLVLTQIHRGDASPEANNLMLSRDVFLDFSGAGFTIQDQISGDIKRSWRLDADQEMTLGRVTLNNEPQLITAGVDGQSAGVEIRDSHIQLHAVSRIDGLRTIKVGGWQENFESVRGRLHLPPGWSLLATTGIDKVQDSWLSKWNLWKLFLLLIIVASLYRLLGLNAALLGLLTLLVIFHRESAPLAIWLNLLAVIALLRVTDGKIKQWLLRYQILSFVALLLLLLPFTVREIRQAVYPHLSAMNYQSDTANEHAADALGRVTGVSMMQAEGEAHPSIVRGAANIEMEEEVLVTGMRASVAEASDSYRSVKSLSVLSKPKQAAHSYSSAAREYDPKAIIQTGPGLPQWRWQTSRLTWSGPVSSAENMHFYLASPWLNRVGHGLAVVLSIALTYLLIIHSQFVQLFTKGGVSLTGNNMSRILRGGSSLCVLLLAGAMMFSSPYSEAEMIISEDILDEYSARLNKHPECAEQCAAIQKVNLKIKDNVLTVSMVIDAQADIAVALPAWRSTWLPNSVLDNKHAAVVKFHNDGQLLARVTKGRHKIILTGPIVRDQIELRFALPVHNVSAELAGWDVTGVHEGFSKTGTVQLQRLKQSDVNHDLLLADAIPSFVEIHRQLALGLEWQVLTTVRRIAPAQGAMSLAVPLLQGESPTSDIPYKEGAVLAVFGPKQQSVSWQSVLTKADSLRFTAADNYQWSEVWSISASPIWHLNFDDLAPVKQQDSQRHLPLWRPWPGESMQITVSRPEALDGQSLSIDSARLEHRLGQRSNNSELVLDLRTSRGQSLPFTLPADALLESLSINGVAQPLINTSGTVDIPLQPGSQQVQLQWRTESGVRWLSKSPEFSFGDINASNVFTHITLPHDRWALLVGGPAVGPVILFWSIILVVLLAAFVLSRSALTPLRFHHWALLGLGVCSTNLISPLIIVLWFFAMGLRGRLSVDLTRNWFRLMQVALLALTFLSLSALLVTIPMGLLSSPDMHVTGNHSYANYFSWFEDRAFGEPKTAWVLSVPIMVYRIAMLAWALWLAFALLKWAQWAWLQINVRALWNVPAGASKPVDKAE